MYTVHFSFLNSVNECTKHTVTVSILHTHISMESDKLGLSFCHLKTFILMTLNIWMFLNTKMLCVLQEKKKSLVTAWIFTYLLDQNVHLHACISSYFRHMCSFHMDTVGILGRSVRFRFSVIIVLSECLNSRTAFYFPFRK